jgi:hypothetical protein
MNWVTTPQQAALAAQGAHFVSVEMMYRPRPAFSPARDVFDACWRSRMNALSAGDAVLLLVNTPSTLDSLQPLMRTSPHVVWIAAEVAPQPSQKSNAEGPRAWGWETPERWQQFRTTDRWARIRFALRTGLAVEDIDSSCYLLMPAHDAVYGQRLLRVMEAAALRYATRQAPAAISPYTPWQHAPLAGIAISPEIITAMNATFARSGNMALRIARNQVQAFWGKMSMLPVSACELLLSEVSMTVWEDDKEIDRALRDCNLNARALYIADRTLYQQTPPVFTREDLRRVIERTIHYSLNIPHTPLGASSLNRPLDFSGRLRAQLFPRFRRGSRLADALIADVMREIEQRLAATGVSWVDWGDYRHVVRIGDPDVEVWGKRSP